MWFSIIAHRQHHNHCIEGLSLFLTQYLATLSIFITRNVSKICVFGLIHTNLGACSNEATNDSRECKWIHMVRYGWLILAGHRCCKDDCIHDLLSLHSRCSLHVALYCEYCWCGGVCVQKERGFLSWVSLFGVSEEKLRSAYRVMAYSSKSMSSQMIESQQQSEAASNLQNFKRSLGSIFLLPALLELTVGALARSTQALDFKCAGAESCAVWSVYHISKTERQFVLLSLGGSRSVLNSCSVFAWSCCSCAHLHNQPS